MKYIISAVVLLLILNLSVLTFLFLRVSLHHRALGEIVGVLMCAQKGGSITTNGTCVTGGQESVAF
jgi:hypothetical protein